MDRTVRTVLEGRRNLDEQPKFQITLCEFSVHYYWLQLLDWFHFHTVFPPQSAGDAICEISPRSYLVKIDLKPVFTSYRFTSSFEITTIKMLLWPETVLEMTSDGLRPGKLCLPDICHGIPWGSWAGNQGPTSGCCFMSMTTSSLIVVARPFVGL